jgi:capsid protein
VNIGRFHIGIKDKAAGYDAGERSRMRRDLGWDRTTPRDEENMVGNDGTREYIRQRLSDLRRNNPIVAGIGNRLARFGVGATGLTPQVKTTDPAWNRKAEAFWAAYGTDCDTRGRLDMRMIQWLAMSLRPIHGGIYLQLMKDGKVRPIECERIRNPKMMAKPNEFTDGVKVDPESGKVISYCVHTRDESGCFGGNSTEAIIQARDMFQFTSPVWRIDQVRELPDLAPIVNALQDVDEMTKYVLNTAKAQSKTVGFLQKQPGGASNSLPRGSSVQTAGSGKRQTWAMEWGEVLEGYTGEDLKMMVSPTPGSNHIPFVDFWLKLCAAAMDFPYEFMALDFSKADWSRMRGILLMINSAMKPWNQWLADNMQKWWIWRVGMEIRPGGALYPAPVDEQGVSQWNRIAWQPPEELWLDRQESAQADMLEWQIGQNTMARIAKRRGHGDLADLLTEKAKEIAQSNAIEDEFGLPRGTLINVQIPGQQPPTQAEAQDEVDKAPEASGGKADE